MKRCQLSIVPVILAVGVLLVVCALMWNQTVHEAYACPCAAVNVNVASKAKPKAKKKTRFAVPPVQMIPSLVSTPVQPPWQRLCLKC